MADSAREIKNLIYASAARLDAGDLAGIASWFTGTADARAMCEMVTRVHADGTPQTKHLTSDVRIDVDEAMTQATPELPLQVIVTGRYRDMFHRIEESSWFDTRIMFIDQVGDTSHHLKW